MVLLLKLPLAAPAFCLVAFLKIALMRTGTDMHLEKNKLKFLTI